MYLSNTNILQSRPVLGGGGGRGINTTDATIDWILTESGADGNLIISGGQSVNAITSSSGRFNVAAGTIISSSLVGVNWVGGAVATSMSLFVNGGDYSFAGTSYVSSSKVMTAFTASAYQSYTIGAYVNSYTPDANTGLYAYGFAKGGQGGSTFTYVDNNNTSQSFSLGEYLTSSVDTPFIFNTNVGIRVTSGELFAQVFSSPYTASFTTIPSSDCKTTTFSNPQQNPSSNFRLASYIPCNSTTYSFRMLPVNASFTDCVSYLNIAYNSQGANQILEQTNISTGSAC